MYIIPKPSRYWSLRYDSSATGNAANFSSSNQGLASAIALVPYQYGSNITHTIPSDKYLDVTGYSILGYYARPIAYNIENNMYTSLTLRHEVNQIVSQYSPTIPDNLEQDWTLNFWVMMDWSPQPGIQCLFFNGNFYKLNGDLSHKPYFQYGLFLDKSSISSPARLRLIIFKQDGSIASNINFNIITDDQVATKFTWQNITITHNAIDREMRLTMKSGPSIFGYTPSTHNFEAKGQYNAFDVYTNLSQTVQIFNTTFGSCNNVPTGGINNRVPHSLAKLYFPFGRSPSQYYNRVIDGVPIPLIYTPKDDSYETYAVTTYANLAHISVWLDKILEPEQLRYASFPFQIAYFNSDVIVSQSVSLNLGIKLNVVDSISVIDSVAASSKFYNFANTMAVTDSLTIKAPIKFNVVTNVGTGDIGYNQGLIKNDLLHDVKVTDSARPNIMSFNIVDGVSATDEIQRRGTIRISVATTIATSEGPIAKTPRQVALADAVTITDTCKANSSTYNMKHNIDVSDNIIKKGPINIVVLDTVRARDTATPVRTMLRQFVSCVGINQHGNDTIELTADSSVSVSQSTTIYKVYSFVSSVGVSQSVVPSDINYSNPCVEIVKAQVPAFTDNVAVTDSVGLISGSAYALGDSVEVGSVVVGFLIRTSGYSPFVGSI